MKLIVLKTNLKEGLDAIGRVSVDSPSTLPILKNFLIETLDNKIRLSATNLEIAITCFVSGKIIEGGGLTIPFNILNSIVNNLQAERINLESDGNNLVIKTDNYEAKIQGIKKDEFPIIPEITNKNSFFEINSSPLRESLVFVTSAAQISDLRPELSGVLFDFQGNQIKLAATDSFRLAEKTLKENQFRTKINKEFKAIMPLKAVNETIRIFKEEEKISIYFDENQIQFKNENTEIISRLINGDFPDYQAIIPKETQTEIILSRGEVINAIKLASSFTDRLNEIKIFIKEKEKNIEVISSSQNLGENKYLIPAKIKGDSVDVVFNWKFLLDGLKNLSSENFVFSLNGDNRPAVIKSPSDISGFYVLMPIKAA